MAAAAAATLQKQIGKATEFSQAVEQVDRRE